MPALELLDGRCWERGIFSFQSVRDLGTLGAHASSAGVSEPVSEHFYLFLSSPSSVVCAPCVPGAVGRGGYM